jgi:hypothetical protein
MGIIFSIGFGLSLLKGRCFNFKDPRHADALVMRVSSTSLKAQIGSEGAHGVAWDAGLRGRPASLHSPSSAEGGRPKDSPSYSPPIDPADLPRLAAAAAVSAIANKSQHSTSGQ